MLICKKISDVFAESMVDNNLIQQEDQEVYSYCIEYVLDLIIFNGSLLTLGALMHHFLISVVYLLALVPLKMMAGGAHANQSFSLAQKKRLKILGMILLNYFLLSYCITLVMCVEVVLVNQVIGIMIYKNWRIGHETKCSNL